MVTAPVDAAPLVEYAVRRSRRRRRTMEITVDASTGVRVAAPMHVSQAEIDAFVRRRWPWVQKQLAKRTNGAHPERRFVDSERFSYLGRDYALRLLDGTGRAPAVRLNGDALEVALAGPHDEAHVAAALERWYRREAQELIAERAQLYAPRIGVEPASLRLSDARTQWGSCSPKGAVRVCWRLIMAPLPVLDYVVVHELCHLRHGNHRARFWGLVRSVLPDYESLRARLRRDGARYRLS